MAEQPEVLDEETMSHQAEQDQPEDKAEPSGETEAETEAETSGETREGMFVENLYGVGSNTTNPIGSYGAADGMSLPNYPKGPR